jgi:tetratricopeptide (TPR) repeat protein
MTTPADPFQSHLDRADALFQAGDVVQAGQIWQAILKRRPDHAAARAGLLRVKQFFDQQDLTSANDALLQEGCTLYDMGEIHEALATWGRILKNDPGHRLALAYANDARRELGLPSLPVAPEPPPAAPFPAPAASRPARPEPEPDPEPAPPPPPAAAPPPFEANPRERAEELVQEGVQIFDMGMVEEAIAKWERALELNPGHKDAPVYLTMARRDQVRAPAIAPRPAAENAAIERDAQILRAEQWLREGKLEEAARAFQQLLEREPQHPRILRGYHQVRALQTAQRELAPAAEPDAQQAPGRPQAARIPEPRSLDGWTGRPAIALDETPPPGPPPPPAPVDPPRALTERGAAPREGIHLPRALERLSRPGWLRTRPRWLQSRRNAGIAAGAAVLALAGLVGYGLHRREQALREAVASAKVDALKPVSRMVQIPQLAETADGIRREGEQALGDDPLLSYYRAQELQRRDPDDPAAVKLLQQARQEMAAKASPGDLAVIDKNLQAGNLEDARALVLGMLRQDPDNADLRDRGRKVLLALAPLYASQGSMDKAQAALQFGRAMFPRDPSWQARLKLLEAIQAMPTSERASWIPLLG